MDIKEYNGYLFHKDGKVTRNGKTIKSSQLYINGIMQNISVIRDSLFSRVVDNTDSFVKEPVKTAKLQHGNKGRKHTDKSITKMKLAKKKGKQILFNDIEFKSLIDAAKHFNVSRQTIYRRNKKALPN